MGSMRPSEDKACYTQGWAQEKHGSDGAGSKASQQQQRKGRGPGSRAKPTPSKWDDAQKWLVGLSGAGEHHAHSKSQPRNSNADDRRLLPSASQKGRDSCSSVEGEGETKKVDCDGALWRASRDCPTLAVRSVCVRDMGTEMTPVASQEPSRTATPLRATTPVMRSPVSSRSSTPTGRARPGPQPSSRNVVVVERKSDSSLFGKANANGRPTRREGEPDDCKAFEGHAPELMRNPGSLESRAMAWDEAERAKNTARYKREDVKIQAWENHEKRRAEMEMKRMEVKAERLKARAQERLTNKLAATRRIAEEKRANAEAKLNERAARTAERADYIRRTGHLPSSFFTFKLPSLCG
uniref:Remorin n=1 Tax=Anthurium amnicola TaxID=1678845 RepID=A0A1D1YD57_9ARAE